VRIVWEPNHQICRATRHRAGNSNLCLPSWSFSRSFHQTTSDRNAAQPALARPCWTVTTAQVTGAVERLDVGPGEARIAQFLANLWQGPAWSMTRTPAPSSRQSRPQATAPAVHYCPRTISVPVGQVWTTGATSSADSPSRSSEGRASDIEDGQEPTQAVPTWIQRVASPQHPGSERSRRSWSAPSSEARRPAPSRQRPAGDRPPCRLSSSHHRRGGEEPRRG
jgi:hypothetical protein